jgi:hypothetical protein
MRLKILKDATNISKSSIFKRKYQEIVLHIQTLHYGLIVTEGLLKDD